MIGHAPIDFPARPRNWWQEEQRYQRPQRRDVHGKPPVSVEADRTTVGKLQHDVGVGFARGLPQIPIIYTTEKIELLDYRNRSSTERAVSVIEQRGAP